MKTSSRKRAFLLAALPAFGAACLGLLPLGAGAQADYPNRPMKVIVPFGPGSVPEAVLRIFTIEMSSRFGQPFVIEHKPGAGTNIAAGFVAAAPPDGYTLLLSNLASNALNKWTYKKLAYDPDAFTTAGMMATTAFYVVVRPDAPYGSVQDLVNAANKSPAGLKYGSLGSGGAAHLVTELFRARTGIRELLHVPYKTGASLDLMAGRLDFMVDASVVNFIKTGQLKALAVATPKRWPTLPDIPTTAEAGYPDVTMQAFMGLSAPAGTPATVLEKINQAMREIAANPENEKRMLALHAQPMVATRAQAAEFIRATSEKWRPVIKSLNIAFED
jgi:tripartite-type tricarboxylate transporter receptor subunit TctC